MIATPPARTCMTDTEFLDTPETNQRVELINEEVVVDAPTVSRQTVLLRACVHLLSIVPNGMLIPSPIDVVFEEGNVPQPDIVWVAEDGKCVIDLKRLYGAPDLIVEILWPSTEARDRGDKYALYEKHGVREYWLVNPEARFVEVYRLNDGRFVRLGLFSAGEQAEFTSPLLEKPVTVAAIFTE